MKRCTYNGSMLSADAQSRLVVVLVGARNPQNIGAAARAIQDFGFSHLRVVNEFRPPFEAAQLEASSAVGATHIMQSAELFDDLPGAIADCTVVAGTTAIGGRALNVAVLSLRDMAPTLRSALVSAAEAPQQDGPTRIALVFGSEKTGLTREQLSHCTHLMTIPMFAPAGRHLSMNLGQSVAVCLYELSREGFEDARELPRKHESLATGQDRQHLSALLEEVLENSGYSRRFPANSRITVIRQLVVKLGETREEAATWMGILRLMLAALKRPPNISGS